MNGYELLDLVRDLYVRQATKHDLHKRFKQTPEEYADAQINNMTNTELIVAIGDALEESGK